MKALLTMPALLKALLLGLVALVALLVWGIVLDNSKLIKNMTIPGSNLLEGGIIGIATVLLAVLFVAPLTGYFGAFLREKRVAPARTALFNSAVTQLKYVYNSYWYFVEIFILQAEQAAAAIQITVTEDLTKEFEDRQKEYEDSRKKLAAIIEMLVRLLNQQGGHLPDAAALGHPHDVAAPRRSRLLVHTAANLSELKTLTQEHSRQLRQRLYELDQTIGFMTAIFPKTAVQHLSKVRDEIIRCITAFEQFIELCAGNVPIVDGQFDTNRTNAATKAYLDTVKIGGEMLYVADSCQRSSAIDKSRSTLSEIQNDVFWTKQSEFVKGIVDFIKFALQEDLKRGAYPAG